MRIFSSKWEKKPSINCLFEDGKKSSLAVRNVDLDRAKHVPLKTMRKWRRVDELPFWARINHKLLGF